MIRAILTLSFLLGLILNSYAQPKQHQQTTGSKFEDVIINRDPGIVPWPLGLEKPFPWYGITGVWMTYDTERQTYFVFKVVNSATNGDKQLAIKHIDSQSCRIIATGVGIEHDKIVTGQMRGPEGLTYRLSLSAYSEKDSQRIAIDREAVVREVMLASITLVEDVGAKVFNTQIGRLTANANIKSCNDFTGNKQGDN